MKAGWIWAALGLVVVLGLGVAGADALGLFGVIKRDYRDIVQVRFRAVDGETQRAVGAIYVNCYRSGQEAACSARPSQDEEVVDVTIASRTVVERSRLLHLKLAEYDAGGNDETPLFILFAHPDYDRIVQQHTLSSLRAAEDSVQTVLMTARSAPEAGS